MTEREMARRKAAARRARKERERKARNRRVALTICLMVAVCLVSIGGTVAWLQDKTDPVTNTFSPSEIGLTLTEETNSSFKIIPGTTVEKDPKVTITNDIPAYLFVKVDNSWTKTFGGTSAEDPARVYVLDTFIDYEFRDEGWTQGTGTGDNGDGIPENVYYREVAANAETKTWYLLEGTTTYPEGAVTYDGEEVNKQMMDDLKSLSGTDGYPKLAFTAYAIQKASFDTAADAWDELT